MNLREENLEFSPKRKLRSLDLLGASLNRAVGSPAMHER